MTDVVLPDLVARVGRGDAEAFAELYGLTCEDVRRLLVSVGDARPPADLDDQLVAAYVRVWRQARTYVSGADVWDWMCATVQPARHTVRAALRAAARPIRRAVSNTSPSTR